MRCKKILIFALLLLFLAVQTVPLMAWDKPRGQDGIEETEDNQGDDEGGDGEEHPWQDTDDDDGTISFSKGVQALISLFFGKGKDVEKQKKQDQKKSRKDVSTKKSKTLFRKYK